jgi:hypothetical protein
MKKLFFILCIFAFSNCFAATGNASDGELFSLLIITILLLPVATNYLIGFIRKRFHEFNERHKKNLLNHNGIE